MTKRFIAVFLALMMLCSFNLTVLAASNSASPTMISLKDHFEDAVNAYNQKSNPRSPDTTENMTAKLYNDDGVELTVQAFPLNPITGTRSSSVLSSDDTKAYILSLNSRYILDDPDGSGGEYRGVWDSSGNIYAYIEVSWDIDNSTYETASGFKLTHISGYWEIENPDIVFLSREIKYAAHYGNIITPVGNAQMGINPISVSIPNAPLSFGFPITSASYIYELSAYDPVIFGGTLARLSWPEENASWYLEARVSPI